MIRINLKWALGEHMDLDTQTFAVQNSDLILSLGSRLDTKATGSPINTFARGAKNMLDIDKSEIDKFTKFNLKIDLKINQDLKIFCKKF